MFVSVLFTFGLVLSHNATKETSSRVMRRGAHAACDKGRRRRPVTTFLFSLPSFFMETCKAFSVTQKDDPRDETVATRTVTRLIVLSLFLSFHTFRVPLSPSLPPSPSQRWQAALLLCVRTSSQ